MQNSTPTFKRGNLERQIPNIPSKIVTCKRCLMTNQRPRITFNEEGVCSGCINTDYKKTVDWMKREDELKKLCDKYRRNDGSWDVLVPSSGGKDSGYVAHQLKHVYGMHPLTVTWTPCRYTDIGFKNFQNMIDAGFTNLLVNPNGKLHRKLARLCFEELGDAFHVFVMGQMALPFHMAKKFGINFIMYGENGEVEYAGDPSAADRSFEPVEALSKKFLKNISFKELVKYGLENKDYFDKEDLDEAEHYFYELPDIQEMKAVNIEGLYFYSYFKNWIPQDNYYYAVKNTNFVPNPERTEGTYSKYSSLDDKLDGLHYYMRFIKFGLGRTLGDVCYEIRDGFITREEGIALINKYEGEFPERYFQDFLDYLDIDEKHFWEVVDSYRLPHLWEKKDGRWIFKGSEVLKNVNYERKNTALAGRSNSVN